MRTYETKLINIDGKIEEVTIEINNKETKIVNKHLENISKMREIGFNNSGKNTIGKSKKSGAMSKANDAKNYKGNKTRTATRSYNAKKINSYNLDETKTSKIWLNQF